MAKSNYLVLYQIGGAGDKQIWRPGSFIELTDEAAPKYIEAGLVRAIEVSNPPVETKSDVVVHEAVEEAPKTKATKGKGGD
jgi:hypothetical protein